MPDSIGSAIFLASLCFVSIASAHGVVAWNRVFNVWERVVLGVLWLADVLFLCTSMATA